MPARSNLAASSGSGGGFSRLILPGEIQEPFEVVYVVGSGASATVATTYDGSVSMVREAEEFPGGQPIGWEYDGPLWTSATAGTDWFGGTGPLGAPSFSLGLISDTGSGERVYIASDMFLFGTGPFAIDGWAKYGDWRLWAKLINYKRRIALDPEGSFVESVLDVNTLSVFDNERNLEETTFGINDDETVVRLYTEFSDAGPRPSDEVWNHYVIQRDAAGNYTNGFNGVLFSAPWLVADESDPIYPGDLEVFDFAPIKNRTEGRGLLEIFGDEVSQLRIWRNNAPFTGATYTVPTAPFFTP